MLRTIAAASALVALSGCARPQPAALPAPPGVTAPAMLDYRITREGADGPVLVAGQTAIDPTRPVIVEHRAPRGSSSTRLRIEAQRLPGGKLLVGMSYDEDSGEVGRIVWTPRMVMAQGGEAVVHNAWGSTGAGRTVRLTLR